MKARRGQEVVEGMVAAYYADDGCTHLVDVLRTTPDTGYVRVQVWDEPVPRYVCASHLTPHLTPRELGAVAARDAVTQKGTM